MSLGIGNAYKDIGTFGQTWSITEPNLLQVIQQQMTNMDQTGQLAEHQKQIPTQAIHGIKYPKPVSGI